MRLARAEVGLPEWPIVDRDRRVAVQALLLVLAAGATSLVAPVVPLVIVPLALGVPHLASELRWVALHGRVPRALVRVSIPISLALAALGYWTWAGGIGAARSARIEVAMACAWIATGAWCGAGTRRAVGVGAAIGLAVALLLPSAALAVREAAVATHAFVTIAIWLFVVRTPRLYALPALLALGLLVAWVALQRGPLVAQAFLLTVHYAVWLRLVPEDAALQSESTALSRSARAWGVALVGAALAAVLVGAAVIGPSSARDAYLAAVRFHVWFEVALGALLLSGGKVAAR